MHNPVYRNERSCVLWYSESIESISYIHCKMYKTHKIHSFNITGQQQRIAIARALVRNPKVLLFDEVRKSRHCVKEKSKKCNISFCLGHKVRRIYSLSRHLYFNLLNIVLWIMRARRSCKTHLTERRKVSLTKLFKRFSVVFQLHLFI
jgi:hypothetical protein